MTADIWAVVPIKELDGAKQRLAPLLSPAQRRALIEVMMGEVLEAVRAREPGRIDGGHARSPGDGAGQRRGARVVTDGARDGHTGSVTAGLRCWQGKAARHDHPARRHSGRTSQEIELVLAAHLPAPAFTISPAHDDLGSNAVICSPPTRCPCASARTATSRISAAARAAGDPPARHCHGLTSRRCVVPAPAEIGRTRRGAPEGAVPTCWPARRSPEPEGLAAQTRTSAFPCRWYAAATSSAFGH